MLKAPVTSTSTLPKVHSMCANRPTIARIWTCKDPMRLILAKCHYNSRIDINQPSAASRLASSTLRLLLRRLKAFRKMQSLEAELEEPNKNSDSESEFSSFGDVDPDSDAASTTSTRAQCGRKTITKPETGGEKRRRQIREVMRKFWQRDLASAYSTATSCRAQMSSRDALLERSRG